MPSTPQASAIFRAGYQQMLAWARTMGTVQRAGVECTGSYGAGKLTRASAGSTGRCPGVCACNGRKNCLTHPA